MARKGGMLGQVLSFLIWLTGIIVSLSVGFAMIDGILSLPSYLGGLLIASFAGWIVVALTILTVIIALVEKFS